MTQSAAGWTRDRAQLIAWQVLMWLAQQPSGHDGDTAPFREDRRLAAEDLLSAMRRLRSEGFTERPDLMVADET